MSPRTMVWGAAGLLGLASAACSETAQSCMDGTPGCPCAAERCVGDLVCAAGVCVDPDDAGSEGGGGTGDTTPPTGDPEHAPRIIDFGANVVALSEGETAIFTATVTDPDGPEDIQGGSLKSADGSIHYGAFEDIGNGTFEIDLSWSELHQATPIDFETFEIRDLRADFFDNSGNADSKPAELRLSCDDEANRACDGSCVSLADDADHCGTCGNACPAQSRGCFAGSCSVAWDTCETDPAQVGSCAEHCAAKSEVCVAACDGQYAIAAWDTNAPACSGFADQRFSEPEACATSLAPFADLFGSARCCCTVGATAP